MKTFKETLMEVQAPLSQGEKNFVDLHKPVPHQNLVPGVTDQDFLFQGGPRRMDPKTASYEIGKSEDESKSAYDKNLKVEEEVEQIDELSSETLASYALKAGRYAKRAATWSGKDAVNYADKRNRGVKKAIDKLTDIAMSKKTNEEAEQIDELDRKPGGVLDRYLWKTHPDRNWQGNSEKRTAGRGLALMKKWGDKNYGTPEPKVKAVRREEAEQIDEIAVDTPERHDKIAAHLVDRYGKNVSRKHIDSVAYDLKSDPDKILAAVKKHQASMKEGVEQVDEIADTPRGKMALAKYLNLASDARGHRGMSTAKKDKRYAGVAKASKILDRRLRGEEVEQVEEAVGNLFKDAAEWKRAAEARGLIVRSATHPSGETTKYHTAKDKEGNTRGHFDHGTGIGRLKEEVNNVVEAKATYCGRCGTTHVPPSKGGKCPAVKEEAVTEKTLTPNEKRARERIAKGIAKSDPNMPMSKKMAIATAKAKQVAEAAKKLIGRQHEIDANNNGRIDAEDFPLLKTKKKAEDK